MAEAVGQQQSDKIRVRDHVKQGLRSVFRRSLKPSEQQASLAPATSSSSELKPSILTKNPSNPSPGLTTQVESLPIGGEAATPSTAQAQSQQAPHGKDLWVVALQRLSERERDALNHMTTSGSYVDTLSSLCDDLDQKLDQSKQKKLQFKIHGRPIIVGDVVSRTLVWINKFKEIGDIIVQFDPVHAALPWAGVRLLLEIATVGNEQMAALFVGVEKVSSMISRCKIYELLYIHNGSSNESSQNLEVALVSAYAVVQRFLVNAYWLSNKKAASKTLHALLNPKKITDFVNDCTVQETQIEIAAGVCQRVYTEEANLDSIKRVEVLRQHLLNFEDHLSGLISQVAVMFTQLEASRQSEILQWISPIPYHDSHVSARERRTEGTGQWLLRDSQFCRWQKSKFSTILWLHGAPGTGKTTLVSTVVDELLKNPSGYPVDNKALAYFYCDRNRRDYQDPVSILSSFVRQLSISRDGRSIQQSTVLLYDKRTATGFASNRLSLEECQDQLRELTEIYPQTTLVLDALDECDKTARVGLVNFLNELVRDSSRLLKIFVASRPDRDLRIEFESGSNVEIKADDNEKDIEKYIKDAITNANSPHFWRKGISNELRKHVCETLLSRSEGMFQWVALQINQLHKLSRERDIKNRLGKLPKNLEDAYHEIYARIQSEDGSASEVARRAFQWIMCSERPISPAMLVTVVCQDPTTDNIDVVDTNFDFVLESCQNLLKVEMAKGNEFCRFSHLSVQEYLENNHFSQLSSDVLVAQICLTFLTDPIQSINLARESSESLGSIDTDRTTDSTMGNENEESNKREERKEFEVFGGLGSTDEPDEPLVFKTSRDIETANRAQEQNDKSEESTESVESNGSGEVSGSEEAKEEGLYKVREYAKPFWLIHVQRSGEVEGDFDSRLIVLLKRFLGSGAKTTPAFENWARSRKSGEIYSMHSRNLFVDILDPPSQLAVQIAGFGLHRMLKDSWERVDPNQKNAEDKPLLAIAAEAGCASTVQSLLDKGAEMNASSIECSSALYYALFKGNESVVKVLLENGADIKIIGEDEESPLQVASGYGYESIARLLLAHGADVNAQGRFNHTALQAASINGDESVVRLLLTHRADVNAQGGDYHTALQAASGNGHESVVGLLLAHGADVNAQGGHYHTALQAASFHGDESIVGLLLAHGADVNAQGGWYHTALQAASEIGDESIVRLLLAHGADVNAQGGHYHTALQTASWGGYESIARLLLAHGADVNAQGGAYDTALQAASFQGHESIARLLLAHGALDQDGKALSAAASHGFESTVAVLLQASKIGVNDALVALLPKEHNVGLDEALISACQQSWNKYDQKTREEAKVIVMLLLKAGAVDREGHALKAATKNGFEEAADLLREAAERNGGRISEDGEGLSDENV